MLFEEWQKWLDSQFLDSQNPDEMQEVADTAVSVTPGDRISPVSDISQSAQQINTAAENVVVPQNREPISNTSIRQGESSVLENLSESVDVPTIDKYLPQFRNAAHADIPVATVTPQELPVPEKKEEQFEAVQENVAHEDIPQAAENEKNEDIQQTQSSETCESDSIPNSSPLIEDMDVKQETTVVATSNTEGSAVETEILSNPTQIIPVEPVMVEAEPKPMEVKTVRTLKQTRNARRPRKDIGLKLINLWEITPRRLEVLLSMNPSSATYSRELKEQRIQSIKVLTDPTISHMDASRILKSPIYVARGVTNGNHIIHLEFAQGGESTKMAEIMSFLESQSKIHVSNTQ